MSKEKCGIRKSISTVEVNGTPDDDDDDEH